MAALVASFAGLTFHNLREFPVSVLVRDDTLILLGVYVALCMWWERTRAVWARRTLLGSGLLHVVGGGLIVGGGATLLVRDLLGQSVAYDPIHHVSHWVYGAASLPLVWAA